MRAWSVYLLSNDTGRTYIGSTTDPQRRLRQHNGEIVGGARSTRGKGPWHMVLYIHGFENRSSACRWERIVKCRARDYSKRHQALLGLVLFRRCPAGRAHYEVPEGLQLVVVEVRYNA